MTTAILPTAKDTLEPQERAVVDRMVFHNLDARKVAVDLHLPVEGVCQILAREGVRKEIGVAMLTTRKDRREAVETELVLSLWVMANYDPAAAFNTMGQLLTVPEMPPEIRMAIKGWKMGKYGPEIVFSDRAQIKLALLQYFARAERQKGEGEEKTTVVYHQEADDDES